MRAEGWVGIGLSLVLLAGCRSHDRAPVEFHEATIDGRLGFKLWISPAAWERLTAHTPDMTSARLDDQVHADINHLVELGILSRHLQCPNPLMSEIGPADISGVMFVGICATPAEVEAVRTRALADT